MKQWLEGIALAATIALVVVVSMFVDEEKQK